MAEGSEVAPARMGCCSMARHVHSGSTAGGSYTCHATQAETEAQGQSRGSEPQVRLVMVRSVSALGALSGLRRNISGTFAAVLRG